MIADEMLFYGGIAIGVIALVVGVVCIFLFKIRRIKLNAQFNYEYGPEIGKSGQSDSLNRIKEGRKV